MGAFFADPAQVRRLWAAAASWAGTPFHPNGRVPGPRGGCSCESLVMSVYWELGVLPRDWQFPRGSIRHYRQGHRSLILPVIEGMLADRFAPIAAPETAGDMLYFADREFEHLAIYLYPHEQSFLHCLKPEGVHVSTLKDSTFSARLKQCWRPMTYGQE